METSEACVWSSANEDIIAVDGNVSDDRTAKTDAAVDRLRTLDTSAVDDRWTFDEVSLPWGLMSEAPPIVGSGLEVIAADCHGWMLRKVTTSGSLNTCVLVG